MRSMKEIINSAIVTNPQAQDLRHMLAVGNADPKNIEQAIIGYSGVSLVDPALKASRQVADCAKEAMLHNVENTDRYLIDAARRTQMAGRKKVVFSGSAAEPLQTLADAVSRKKFANSRLNPENITLGRF